MASVFRPGGAQGRPRMGGGRAADRRRTGDGRATDGRRTADGRAANGRRAGGGRATDGQRTGDGRATDGRRTGGERAPRPPRQKELAESRVNTVHNWVPRPLSHNGSCRSSLLSVWDCAATEFKTKQKRQIITNATVNIKARFRGGGANPSYKICFPYRLCFEKARVSCTYEHRSEWASRGSSRPPDRSVLCKIASWIQWNLPRVPKPS